MKHPHADLIKQMVDDDTLRETYGDEDDFPGQVDDVVTQPELHWRLVTPKPKTITIVANGKTYELPEPMRVAPQFGGEYYVAKSNVLGPYKWSSNDFVVEWLEDWECHATREAAQQWVDAMAEIRGGK